MTYSESGQDAFAGFFSTLRQVGAWTARAFFGLFVVMAAGLALLATTIVGLIIALAALFLRAGQGVSGKSSSARTRFYRAKVFSKSTKPRKAQTGDTLDAHQTPDGWVIETPSSK